MLILILIVIELQFRECQSNYIRVSTLECFFTPTILLDIGDNLTEVMNFGFLGLEWED